MHKGDLEWHWQAYNFKRYYRCNFLCSKCFASKTSEDLLFTNMLDDAMWRDTHIGNDDFKQNALRFGNLPALCLIEGWSSDTLLWDMMHNLFIGIGRDVCGAALARLCERKYYSKSDDVDVHLKVFVAECRKWCLGNRVGMQPPKIDHLAVGLSEKVGGVPGCSYPELDVKAASVKLMTMFLASELYYASLTDDEELKTLGTCFYYLASFIWTLQNAGMWLTEPQADLAYNYGMRFLIVYRHLAAQALGTRTEVIIACVVGRCLVLWLLLPLQWLLSYAPSINCSGAAAIDAGQHSLAVVAKRQEQPQQQASTNYPCTNHPAPLYPQAIASGRMRYKLRPKLHYLHHAIIDLQKTRLNPFFSTCFLDEDYMGKVKALSSKCHASTVVHRTLQRYLILLGQRWAPFRRRASLGERAAKFAQSRKT